MSSYLWLGAGIALAAAGGDLFVRGLVAFGQWLRVPLAMVAATVAALATSAPELAVAINAALTENTVIALGDSLGSNVVNLGLVLGAAVAIGGAKVSRDGPTANFVMAALAPVAVAALLADGHLGRVDAIALLALFVAWLAASIIDARRRRIVSDIAPKLRPGTSAIFLLVGLALMLGAGRMIVIGATGVAAGWGVDGFVVGAVIVAAGTSTPELAVAVMSRLRGHDEVGLSALLGSNVVNALLIVPIALLIHPSDAPWYETARTLGFGLIVVALAYPRLGGAGLGRGRGILLLAVYAAFVITMLPIQN